MTMIRFPALPYLLLFVGGALAAPDVSISDHFKDVQGYRFELVSRGTGGIGRQVNLTDEVLKEYGLVGWTRWDITAQGESRASRCVVLEMLSAPRAYGLLSHWAASGGEFDTFEADNGTLARDARNWTGVIAGRYLLLVQGKDRIEGRDRVARRNLASALARVIPEENIPPVTVLNLPSRGLKPSSVRSVVGPLAARRLPQLPEDMVIRLPFDQQLELTLACYEEDRPLALVGFPTPALAREALPLLAREAARSGWTLKTTGILLAMTPDETPRTLLDEVVYSPKIQWIRDKRLPRPQGEEARILYRVLISWIFFTVAFIGATLIGGASLAGLRFVIRRYSRTVQRMNETIRLGIADP